MVTTKSCGYPEPTLKAEGKDWGAPASPVAAAAAAVAPFAVFRFQRQQEEPES